jgi:acyl dehydratase
MALVTPLVLKASHLLSLTTAKTAHAATKVSAAYNSAIDKMVEDCKRRFAKISGWATGRGSSTVTSEALINSASGVSHNPFWTDEAYATATRWGGLIGYPMYSAGGSNATTVPSETPECGFDRQLWPGQDWEFYQPIRVDDTLRTWMRNPQLIEQKFPDRGGIRGFVNLEGDFDIVNQRNEIVSTWQNYTVRVFYPDGVPMFPGKWERYGFSKEEIFFLDSLARAEKVRGADVRYWEDTNVGDMLDPVVIGPTNFQDISSQGGGGGFSRGGGAARDPNEPISKLLEKEGVIERNEYIQDEKGFYYKSGGDMSRHWDDVYARAEGEPGAFLWGLMSVKTMTRCLTNWIGDDAFVRSYKWRHIFRTLVGDAAFSQGKVTNKRRDNGEYLVDIFIWHQDIRGFIADTVVATVALRSRTESYPDMKKVVDY